MSEKLDGSLPQAPLLPAANRRQFLGNAAAAAAAVVGVPALLAACGDGVTDAQTGRTTTAEGPRASLGGGRDPSVTLHNMMAATIGSATDVKVPALEKGVTTTYIQRVVTDTDRTGTGLATVLKGSYKFSNGATVQVIVQNGRGTVWPARNISKQSDLVYAMKDALATNTLHYGVLRESLTGSAVVAISKSSVIQFQDSAASDYYGNHLDVASRGFSDVFNTTVSGIKLASTTRDITRC